jgi:hypothetical protein
MQIWMGRNKMLDLRRRWVLALPGQFLMPAGRDGEKAAIEPHDVDRSG